MGKGGVKLTTVMDIGLRFYDGAYRVPPHLIVLT